MFPTVGDKCNPTVLLTSLILSNFYLLFVERGAEPLKRVRCVVTHLREREEQLARVWTLFKAEADDRITVDSSWPSYVISDNADNRQSIFTAFEVGR